MLRQFINFNASVSNWLEKLLPSDMRIDGNQTFSNEFLAVALEKNNIVYDIGGGSQPYVSSVCKLENNLTVVGLDISEDELNSAPVGSYDKSIVADICSYEGNSEADLIICQATLEHVPDVSAAITSLSSILKPGGKLYIFVPCRNALFAQLNLVLPETIKQKLLYYLFPHKAQGHDGFKAYYDKCTPSQIRQLANHNGLKECNLCLFWTSSYFKIFVPAFLVWKIYQMISWIFCREDAAETFIYVLRKKS